eukprot:1190249-Prorocentrum_minimum.AAC.4
MPAIARGSSGAGSSSRGEVSPHRDSNPRLSGSLAIFTGSVPFLLACSRKAFFSRSVRSPFRNSAHFDLWMDLRTWTSGTDTPTRSLQKSKPCVRRAYEIVSPVYVEPTPLLSYHWYLIICLLFTYRLRVRERVLAGDVLIVAIQVLALLQHVRPRELRPRRRVHRVPVLTDKVPLPREILREHLRPPLEHSAPDPRVRAAHPPAGQPDLLHRLARGGAHLHTGEGQQWLKILGKTPSRPSADPLKSLRRPP